MEEIRSQLRFGNSWFGCLLKLKLADIAYYSLLILVLVLYIIINRQAGNAYPTPWPDEAHFLWQANSIAENNTLFCPELNTDRTIMWQPPGYLIFVGTVFKVFGSSLNIGRSISLLLMIVLFLMLMSLTTHYGNRWSVLFICSLFFLNSRFIACGNIARMEALLLFLVLAAVLLIQRNKSLFGLALLAVTPIVHFNGFYFALFGFALVIFKGELFTIIRSFTRTKILILIAVAAIWIGYAILIASNWDSFVLDMKYQFSRKEDAFIWQLLIENEALLLYLFLLIGIVIAIKLEIRVIELLFLALPALIIYPLGHELWYEVIDHLGYLLVAIFFIHISFLIFPIDRSLSRQYKRMGMGILLTALLITWNYRSDRIDNMFNYGSSFNFATMSIKGGAGYITENDQKELTRIIDSLATDKISLIIEFQPHADAFYFIDRAKNNHVTFSCPLFQHRKPDLLIVHFSRHLPNWWPYGIRALARTALTQDSSKHILYQRDQTEKWYFAKMSD